MRLQSILLNVEGRNQFGWQQTSFTTIAVRCHCVVVGCNGSWSVGSLRHHLLQMRTSSNSLHHQVAGWHADFMKKQGRGTGCRITVRLKTSIAMFLGMWKTHPLKQQNCTKQKLMPIEIKFARKQHAPHRSEELLQPSAKWELKCNHLWLLQQQQAEKSIAETSFNDGGLCKTLKNFPGEMCFAAMSSFRWVSLLSCWPSTSMRRKKRKKINFNFINIVESTTHCVQQSQHVNHIKWHRSMFQRLSTWQRFLWLSEEFHDKQRTTRQVVAPDEQQLPEC